MIHKNKQEQQQEHSEPLRTVWLHVHVPKAGGSTVRQLLNRNFGTGYYNSNSLLETKQYTSSDVSEIIRCHPWLTGFSDHKLSLRLPFDTAHADIRVLCFVRDPLQRFISRFFFHRNFEEVHCIAQQTSFREFAQQELVENFAHPQTNSQIRFLNGGFGDQDLTPIQAAIETGKTYLFPIERFDETCVFLERSYSHTFSDLSYVRVNTSDRQDSISAVDREFALSLLNTDLPLVEMAHRQLDRALSSCFDTPTTLQNSLVEFRERCSRRFHNFRPLRDKHQPLPTVDEIAQDKSTNLPRHLRPSKR